MLSTIRLSAYVRSFHFLSDTGHLVSSYSYVTQLNVELDIIVSIFIILL